MENLINEYEKEFQTEVEQENVSVEDMLNFGISKSALALEVYLKNIYGEGLFKNEVSDKTDVSAKDIKKLTDFDLNRNQELQNILSELEQKEFDEQVNKVLIMIRENEE